MYYVDKLGHLVENKKVKTESRMRNKKSNKTWKEIGEEIKKKSFQKDKPPQKYPLNGIFCPSCGAYSGLNNPFHMVINKDFLCKECGEVILRAKNISF